MPPNPHTRITHTRGIAALAATIAAFACGGEDVAVGSATEAVTGVAATGDDTEGLYPTTGGAFPDPTGWMTSGIDPVGPCAGELCALPPAELVPTDKPDGLPSPLPGVYDDQGPAPPDNGFRALIGFPTRQRELLEQRVAAMYDPDSLEFRKYLGVEAWMIDHAPPAADVELVRAWLRAQGFTVNWEAQNRLLLHFSGKVADFNRAFRTELHICMRKNPLWGDPPFPVYCTLTRFTVPKFMASRTNGLITADLPAKTGQLAKEVGEVKADPPGPEAYGPPVFYRAYEVQPLFDAGFTGQGSRLGIIGAGTIHMIDLQIFWKSFGIDRWRMPIRVPLMEPAYVRITETSLDVQWASSLAPDADVYLYEGPDARNTALLFAWNEAIARNEVDVLTFSFAHREDSEPKTLRHQYDESALMGAALGMTLISASGDSAKPDTPCTSPYVTCVGGTHLEIDAAGQRVYERAWEMSGSGQSKSFPVPAWQEPDCKCDTRATADLALNASTTRPMWMRRWKKWEYFGGTSFSAPAFAGIVAVINSQRRARGLPRVGFLNPLLYRHGPTRATFRDVTSGYTEWHKADPGWDYPTGLGTPRAAALAAALP
ncbi:MAG TPA: S53 family serine peptidase [Nannocystis sp.]